MATDQKVGGSNPLAHVLITSLKEGYFTVSFFYYPNKIFVSKESARMGQIWKCNGDDKRTMPRWLWEKDLSILSNEEEMAKVLLAWKKAENRKEIILPLVQNLRRSSWS